MKYIIHVDGNRPFINQNCTAEIQDVEIITKKERKLNRGVEHYLELYAIQNVVMDSAMNVFQMCVMVELDVLPTEEEFCEVDDFLACGTPPGNGSFQSVFLENGAAISAFAPLSVLAQRLRRRIPKQSLASRLYPQLQCGFMFGRSTVDMIFDLRQPLLEKCLEQRQPLFIAFVGETFDLFSKR